MPRKHKKLEARQSRKIDGEKQVDVVRKQLKNFDEYKAEISHLPNQLHKGIENLIEAKKAEKQAFESAFSQLQKDIKEAKENISEIQEREKSSSIDNSINNQLKVLENYPSLKDMIQHVIQTVQNERAFLSKQDRKMEHIKTIINVMPTPAKEFALLFQYSAIDIESHLKQRESPNKSKITTMQRYINHFEKSDTKALASMPEAVLKAKKKELLENPIYLQAQDIAKRRQRKDELKKKIEKTEAEYGENQPRINNLETTLKLQVEMLSTLEKDFKKITSQDEKTIKEHCLNFMRIQEYVKNDELMNGALQILNNAYLQQLRHNQIPEKKSMVDIESTLENFQNVFKKIKNDLDTLINNKNLYHINLEESQKDYKDLEKATLKNEDDILQNGSKLAISYVEFYQDTHGYKVDKFKECVSFYNFIKNNIAHRISNSLDELQNKSQEALSFLEEEINKLSHDHYQEQLKIGSLEALKTLRESKLSDKQKEIVMDKGSPADKLQKHVEASLKDVETTDKWKQVVTSYMHGLFEKSHHEAIEEETMTQFFQENFEEAKQIGTYIEQKYFIRKPIQEDVIKLAIHLKHEFGSPIHETRIDADFNIVNATSSSKRAASTFQLDVNRQGKILKDQREQRVYLIGFQDQAESSSNNSPKTMALFALQAENPGYLKFGAGTPLPTGGVVDVKTAQKTTREQPNLYKATIGIETIQETQGQKELEMHTLDFFETETVKNYRTQAHLYDITMFTGKVKDTHNTAPVHDSKEYQETTGPCMVDMGKLIAGVNNEFTKKGTFRFRRQAERLIKKQVAIQALGIDAVPQSDQGWQTNGEIRWVDFHEASTSMDLFAKYVVLHYREELGLR